MTEITTYGGTSAVADYQTRAVQRLGEWAASADAAYHVAQRLVETSFVPQQFRGKPYEATAAILAGAEVGLQPMAALKAFDVIQGQAAPRALALRAIVQSYGHEIVLIESTTTRARVKGRRKGSTEWQTVTWTVDRAKDLGLTGKDNWKKQPGAMLVARATSELARLIAADAILGIGYTAEEVADGATDQAQFTPDDVVEASPVKRTLRREPPRGAAPSDVGGATDVVEVEGVEPGGSTQPSPAEQDGITQPQLKKMGALMREAGLTQREDALAFVEEVIGHPITSRNDLTKEEASLVLEVLQHEAEAADGGAS